MLIRTVVEFSQMWFLSGELVYPGSVTMGFGQSTICWKNDICWKKTLPTTKIKNCAIL